MKFRNWIIVLVLGLCGMVRATADEAADRAAGAIEKLGGQVFRYDSKPGKPDVEWRVTLLGKGVTEAVLKELAQLSISLVGDSTRHINASQTPSLPRRGPLRMGHGT